MSRGWEAVSQISTEREKEVSLCKTLPHHCVTIGFASCDIVHCSEHSFRSCLEYRRQRCPSQTTRCTTNWKTLASLTCTPVYQHTKKQSSIWFAHIWIVHKNQYQAEFLGRHEHLKMCGAFPLLPASPTEGELFFLLPKSWHPFSLGSLHHPFCFPVKTKRQWWANNRRRT